MSIQKKMYDTLYDDVKNFFFDTTSGQLSAASVGNLVRHAMQAVQTGKQWSGLTGSAKKEIVLGVITEVVKDLLNDPDVVGDKIDPTLKQIILQSLEFAPILIDAAVDFAKTYKSRKDSGQKFCGCL